MWDEFQLGGYDQQQFEWVQQTCLAVCPKQEQSYIETKQPQLTLVCLLFKSWTVTTHTQKWSTVASISSFPVRAVFV